MTKIVFKSVCLILSILSLAIFITASAVAEESSDTIELKNGDKKTGTLLTQTFSVTSPYTFVTVKKDQILEIRFNDEYQNNDIVDLKAGGLLEGTIEETEFSFKDSSGNVITLDKKQCKKIVLRKNE